MNHSVRLACVCVCGWCTMHGEVTNNRTTHLHSPPRSRWVRTWRLWWAGCGPCTQSSQTGPGQREKERDRDRYRIRWGGEINTACKLLMMYLQYEEWSVMVSLTHLYVLHHNEVSWRVDDTGLLGVGVHVGGGAAGGLRVRPDVFLCWKQKWSGVRSISKLVSDPWHYSFLIVATST